MPASTSVPGSRIFISYRHADSAAYAGRLYDRLKDRYGDDQVFRDLEMDFGIDFVERIEDTVGSCVVMVVVIGPGWLDARDAAGNRRLDEDDDYVRVEISSALQRSIRVIPVLVGEAQMPDKHDLPDALRALARRNALPISDSRWDYDVGRLMRAVSKALEDREAQLAAQAKPADEPATSAVEQPAREAETETPPAQTPAPEQDARRRRAWPAAAAAALVVAGVIVAVVISSGGSSSDRQPKPLGAIAVGGAPEGVAVAGDVWVANHKGWVTRIDAAKRTPTKRISVGIGELDSVTGSGSSVWVTGDTRGEVALIDARSGTVRRRIALEPKLKGLVVGGGSVWVANCLRGTVLRIPVEPGTPPTPFRVGGAPRSVAVGDGRVYAAVRPSYPTCNTQPADPVPGQVAVLLDQERKFRTLQTVGDATDVAFAKGSLWVADKERHRVLRLDPQTGDVERKVTVDPGLASIAADDHGVWALSRTGTIGTVTLIDPETVKRVGDAIDLRGTPREVAVGAGLAWVTQATARTVTPIQP